jgi:hypothetical protein
MILAEEKPFSEILGYLEDDEKIFVLGCNSCEQSSGICGPEQVESMKNKLIAAGKKVTGTGVFDLLCDKTEVKATLRDKMDEINAADSVLVMTCGVGIQAVAAAINKVCHPACDTINLGGNHGESRGNERCIECGQCIVDYTGGICPLTACTKGLLNGPCGGANKGKCEASPNRNCGWELIYNRLKARNQLDKIKAIMNPLDHSKLTPKPELVSIPAADWKRSKWEEAK